MKLELGKILIKDVIVSNRTSVNSSVLHVHEKELIDILLVDERIKNVTMDVAKPGESVRIAPVKDVLEARVKVSSHGEIFPGSLGKITQVGEGRTHVLSQVAIVTVGKIVGFQEGIIDMQGIGARYTPFSSCINICLIFEPQEGITPHEYEEAVRIAGLRAAAYIGEAGRFVTPDEIVEYETKKLKEQLLQYKTLPAIGYVHMLQSQGLLHDTYYYGVDCKHMIPTIMYPTEIMDGAIVSGNCVAPCDKVTSYHHLNNPVIEDLYQRHGKDLNFIAVILTNENVFLADKERSSDMTAKLCDYLGLDGVIISEEGYGNPDTDLMMNAKKISKLGMEVVLLTDEFPGRDGKSQSLADFCEEANALVSCGNGNEMISLPAMDKVIGSLEDIDVMIGGYAGSLKEDQSMEVELQIIIGATVANGFNHLAARGI